MVIAQWYLKLEVMGSMEQHTIKRQLYSGPFTLREAASFIFWH